MPIPRFAPCSAVILALVSLGGCSWFQSHDGALVPAANSPIADVPVPAGFSRTEDSTSTAINGNNVRLVNHFYKGSDDVDPVVKFYQTQMPENGWKWVDQNEAHGSEITIRYTKDNESCAVTVAPKQWGGSMIHIKIDATDAIKK